MNLKVIIFWNPVTIPILIAWAGKRLNAYGTQIRILWHHRRLDDPADLTNAFPHQLVTFGHTVITVSGEKCRNCNFVSQIDHGSGKFVVLGDSPRILPQVIVQIRLYFAQ